MSQSSATISSKSTMSEKSDHASDFASSTSSEWTTRSAMNVAGASLTSFCTVGFMNAFGLFEEYYLRVPLHNKSSFDVGWIGSFALFLMFMGAAPAGILADKFGPTILMLAGSFGFLLAIFMISLCTEYYQFFLSQGLLLGLSMSFVLCPAVAAVPRYFVKHRGLAMGLTIAGSSIGGVLWPIMADQLLNHDKVSFAWTIRTFGFIMLPLLAFACAVVRFPPKPTPTKADRNQRTQPERQIAETDESLVKNYAFLTFCAGLAIFYFGMFAPFFFVTSYAISLNISTSIAFYLISILNGASLFGRILPGMLADKFGPFNMISISAIASAIIGFCWTSADSVGGLVVWALAYGFCSGSIMSLQLTCPSKLVPPERSGAALGLTMASVALTSLFGTPICGQLIEKSYLALSLYAGATMLLGGMLMIISRLRQNRGLFVKI